MANANLSSDMPPLPRRNHANRGSRWRTARGYLLLPHLLPILVVELATVVFASIAWAGFPPFDLLSRMFFAMLGGQLAIGAVNEIVDLPDDKVYKPEKPLVSGAVSLQGAKIITMLGIGLMIVFGASLGLVSLVLLALGTALGIIYDLWLKRTRWSWLPYLLALPLLPIWVFVTLGRANGALLLLYPLGALAAIGVHFAQALPDTASDRHAGLRTLTSRLGRVRTFALAWLAALTAPALAWVAAWRMGILAHGGTILTAAAVTVTLLALNLMLAAHDWRAACRVTFTLVALSTLASGVAWTAAAAQR